MASPFLTARWSDLAIVTYEVEPSLLSSRVPPGMRLDLRDGMAFVSLVAFRFLNTRVKGIAVPGMKDFDEINLRFYVRKTGYRGVCFIREFVPHGAISLVARLLYNEPYVKAPVSSTIDDDESTIVARYDLEYAGRAHSLTVTADKPAYRPDNASIEHFLKEHQWGFGISSRDRLIRYEVEHPIWQVYPVASYAIDFDFASVYGEEWEAMNDATPHSIILAVGSDVAVFPRVKVNLLREALGERQPRGNGPA